MERFEAILELTGGREGTIGHAGQIEELLVAEVRKLGHRAMQDWAVGAEARAAERLPREVPGTRIYKKALSWWCCYGSVTIQERIWQAPGRDYLRVFSPQAGIRARGKSQRLQRAIRWFRSTTSGTTGAMRLSWSKCCLSPSRCAGRSVWEALELPRLRTAVASGTTRSRSSRRWRWMS